jgi:hypothetical protein
MTRIYVPQRPPASYEFWDTGPLIENLSVYEPAERTRKTGLFDKHGAPLMAHETMEPVGYVRLQERGNDRSR